jgi:hypothetical protein
MTLNDNSPMPFDKYKGDKGMREYVEDNLDVLKEEIKRDNKQI